MAWKTGPTMVSLSCRVQESQEEPFHDWQARFNTAASSIPNFISSELSYSPGTPSEWMIVQRFQLPDDLKRWNESKEFKGLVDELKHYADSIKTKTADISTLQNGVTEIFVTEISRGKELAFQKWSSKINQVESQFPGFRGTYLQSPGVASGTHWITMIRFDTQEHLDIWLNSEERKKVLGESKNLISSLEGHRVASPYAGWFATSKSAEVPPAWKQGVIVLLVLYPIVMVEMWALAFLANYMNLSLRTFISNVISVGLLTYPCIPWASKHLQWWLTSSEHTLKGCLLIGGIFVLEILVSILVFN